MSARPFEIVCDSGNREEWLKARMSGVGASEAACILGQSPWGSAIELWSVKTGQMPAPNLDSVEAVFWGAALENAIVAGYGQRTGRKVVPFGIMLRSIRFPWLTATPDAFTSETADAASIEDLTDAVVDLRVQMRGRWTGNQDGPAHRLMLCLEHGGWFPLQIKNIGFGSAEHWGDGVPVYYRIQCTQEAIVCGASRTSAAALIAGQRLAWDDVEVSMEGVLERQIVNLTRRFMEDNVAANVRPAPDASDSARRALTSLFPSETPGKRVILGASSMERAYELEAAKSRLNSAKEECDRLDNLIRAELGDAESAVYPDGSGHTFKSQIRKATQIGESTFRVLRRQKAKV